MELIITVLTWIFLGAFAYGLFRKGLRALGENIILLAISAVGGLLIFAIVGVLFGGLGLLWKLGAALGAIYCVLCWIFGWTNQITKIWATSHYQP